jgi:N-acetylmuramoyl-L-alanine amidase
MKSRILFFLTACLWIANLPSASAALRPFKVVVDPGHGGTDHGTTFDDGTFRITEKSVTLLIARQVASQLKAEGVDVVLTRSDDRELPLGKRTELANRLGADVFLSIHMNSTQEAPRRSRSAEGAEGVETYILDNATDASSRRLAHLENTVISHDGNETPQQHDVALILRDLRLDANLAESKRLACSLQNNLSATGNRLLKVRNQRNHGRRNRGVKQALFHVLLGADMPSVLLEAGFLSSPRDRALVLSYEGRKAIAASISQAIEQFRKLKGTHAATIALSNCQVR